MFVLGEKSTKELHEEGAWMHIIDPATGLFAYADKEEKKPCRIKIKGWESETGKAIGLEGRNKLAKDAMQKAVYQGKKAAPEMTMEDLITSEERDAEKLSELVIDWENIMSPDGKQIKFSKEAIQNAFIRQSWLRKQAADFLNDGRSFFTTTSED